MLPGPVVVVGDSPPASVQAQGIDPWFVVGLCGKGPTAPTLVRGIIDFKNRFGDRVSYSILYDALDAYFREGGSRAYVARVVGPNAVTATFMLKDSLAANTLAVSANSPGDWGNNLRVAVLTGDQAGEFKLQISDATLGVLETSTSLVDKTAALAWAQTYSQYVVLTDQASVNDPAVVAATPLAGGTDDRAAVADADWALALARFSKDFGAGQVSYPGRTTDTAHTDLNSHAAAYNRIALLDAPDSPVVATLTTSAKNAAGNGRWAGMYAPWMRLPGLTPGTYRTIPPSAIVAGIIARNDGAGRNPNIAAAGANGAVRSAIGLSQPAWIDSDRQTLNEANVNVIRTLGYGGGITVYGDHTLALNDPVWMELPQSRLIMSIVADSVVIAESFEFAQIDGSGITIGTFGDTLATMLQGYYGVGALYGATPQDAYRVDVGPDINPPAQLQLGKMAAAMSVRVSPHAEVVQITIIKVPITQTLVAAA